MTIGGTVNKAFMTLALLVAAAVVSWTMYYNGYSVVSYAYGGAIVGFILALIISFKPTAALLTMCVFIGMLVAYKSGMIKATENFKLGVFAATAGIALVYLLSFVLGFFGVTVPYLHDNSLIGIGISVVIVIIAALNFVLDFDFIEKGARQGAPKYMEWYGAFGLMVTLVWLYVEIIRLLSKLWSRD